MTDEDKKKEREAQFDYAYEKIWGDFSLGGFPTEYIESINDMQRNVVLSYITACVDIEILKEQLEKEKYDSDKEVVAFLEKFDKDKLAKFKEGAMQLGEIKKIKDSIAATKTVKSEVVGPSPRPWQERNG